MKNLGRALRKTLKYRFSLLASFVCSLLVAVLWSANLGAVYPFVEVVLTGHSLHDWVEQEAEKSETLIADRQARITGLEQRIEKLNGDEPGLDQFKASGRIGKIRHRRPALALEVLERRWCLGSKNMRPRLHLQRWHG